MSPRNRRPFSATASQVHGGFSCGTLQRCRPTSTSTSTLSCVLAVPPARARVVYATFSSSTQTMTSAWRASSDQARRILAGSTISFASKMLPNPMLNQALGFGKGGASDADGAGIQLSSEPMPGI